MVIILDFCKWGEFLMANYIVTDTELTSIANSIRTKGGTNELLSFPEEFINAIGNISTGGSQGGAVTAKEVNFRDYDGTVVYSYTPTEFAALTAMPANPDHSGDAIPLTSQGWNWSFADAQAYVAEHGRLEVEQMYATTDGKTHVLIHLEQGRTSPLLGVCPNGTVDVDWGDGTAHDTLTGTSVTTVQWTPTHNYVTPGDYDIKLTCSGTMGFYGNGASRHYCGLLRYSSSEDVRNRAYQNSILAVYCSDNVTSIGDYAFSSCYSLSTIALSNGVTSIGRCAFSGCYNLSSVTIPSNVTNIGNNTFNSCASLTSIAIPSAVTSIDTSAFSGCYNLSSVTISDNVTNIGTSAFQSCYSLTSITLSNSVTSISNTMISTCYSLSSITLPSSLTSIGNYAFGSCYCLSSVTIPNNVTNIGTYAFQYCYGLAELHFLPTTPPTVSNSNAFSNVPTDCKIFVPAGSLNTYTTATNYPSSSTYTYIEE